MTPLNPDRVNAAFEKRNSAVFGRMLPVRFLFPKKADRPIFFKGLHRAGLFGSGGRPTVFRPELIKAVDRRYRLKYDPSRQRALHGFLAAAFGPIPL